MKDKTEISYTYNPTTMRLRIFENGKSIGGFVGRVAAKQFMKLLDSGSNITIAGDSINEQELKDRVNELRSNAMKRVALN